ncbi:MAG: tetratricopeptide repeat protein [Candidatus Thorarchaeota archaeon]
MTEIKPKEIIQAEELISKGKTEEALEIVRKFQQTAWFHFSRIESDKALEIAMQSKELLEKIGKEIDLANNSNLIGYIYLQKGDFETSLKFGFRCAEFHEKINNKVGIAAGLTFIGMIYWIIGEYDQAIEYCKKSSAIKEINLATEANNLRIVGNILLWKGDLDQSLEYCEKGLRISQDENFVEIQVSFLWYLGFIFSFKYDFKKAEEYLKRSCELAGKHKIHYIKAYSLLGLINISFEENNIIQTEKYLKILREYAIQEKDKLITNIYSVSKGFVLINQSGRIRDRAEAESLFREVIDDGVSQLREQTIYMYALYYLISMYLEELMMSNDWKILDDIRPLVSDLSTKAEKWQSFLFQIEAKIFQANIDLIQINYDGAKKLLTEAQQLAESTNNQYFAQVISNEHDRLLELQDNQEILNNTKEGKSENSRLTSFSRIANVTNIERSKEISELKPEIPVFLLMITDSGAPLFSHSFSRELSFEDDIISSFISAFNSFSGELFSKGLDRARFGEYIILIEPVDLYSVCYLFKGQTYPAKQKLSKFIENVRENTSLWDNLEKFYKTSQVAELKDLPQIETLIKDIFIA